MLKHYCRIGLTSLLMMLSSTSLGTLAPESSHFDYPRLNRYMHQSNNIWDNLRYQFRLPDLSEHPRVKAQAAWLLKSPERFEKMLAQAEPYLYHVLQEIKRRRLPAELALMPMIESAYNPFAYSAAGAAGLWQIMPGTGTGFGLKQDWWYDGRRDVYDSTQVALDYLVYLYKFFDRNWLYAIAAYDSGEGTIKHAISRNLRKKQAVDIWSLRLPKETTNYVPRLLALVEIIKHPRKYHIYLPPIANRPYFVRIPLDFQVRFRDVARITKLDLTEIYRLNPGYNRAATDPDGPYHIALPIAKARTFHQRLADLTQREYRSLKKYTVKMGDTLSGIAKKFETTVALLIAANKLKSSRILRDQTLILPTGTLVDAKDLSRNVITARISKLGPKKIVYYVQAKDTLATIARRFKTRVSSLQFWNQLSFHQRLRPGKKLIIWQKQRNRRRHRRVRTDHYRVRKGDTLSAIAHRYRVSVADLKKWNPKLGDRYIRPNQYIEIIPDSA